jgi:hypothetical protein
MIGNFQERLFSMMKTPQFLLFAVLAFISLVLPSTLAYFLGIFCAYVIFTTDLKHKGEVAGWKKR